METFNSAFCPEVRLTLAAGRGASRRLLQPRRTVQVGRIGRVLEPRLRDSSRATACRGDAAEGQEADARGSTRTHRRLRERAVEPKERVCRHRRRNAIDFDGEGRLPGPSGEGGCGVRRTTEPWGRPMTRYLPPPAARRQCCALLAFAGTSALAQDLPPPVQQKKPTKPLAPKGAPGATSGQSSQAPPPPPPVLLVTTDLPCTFTIDGGRNAPLTPGENKRHHGRARPAPRGLLRRQADLAARRRYEAGAAGRSGGSSPPRGGSSRPTSSTRPWPAPTWESPTSRWPAPTLRPSSRRPGASTTRASRRRCTRPTPTSSSRSTRSARWRPTTPIARR